MITDQRAIYGGESLAFSVRELAERAHRLLGRSRAGVEVDLGEAQSLLDQIRRTRISLRGTQQDDLRRWLDSLRQQVREVCEVCTCV